MYFRAHIKAWMSILLLLIVFIDNSIVLAQPDSPRGDLHVYYVSLRASKESGTIWVEIRFRGRELSGNERLGYDPPMTDIEGTEYTEGVIIEWDIGRNPPEEYVSCFYYVLCLFSSLFIYKS